MYKMHSTLFSNQHFMLKSVNFMCYPYANLISHAQVVTIQLFHNMWMNKEHKFLFLFH